MTVEEMKAVDIRTVDREMVALFGTIGNSNTSFFTDKLCS